MSVFCWPARVYYEDTDHGGVVYHANYLKFMERARTEWLRSLGVEQDRLLDEFGLLFAVHHMILDFLLPARFNQLLDVTVTVREKNRAGLVFDQSVRQQDTLYCQAEVRVVCLDAQTKKVRRMPVALYEIISGDKQ